MDQPPESRTLKDYLRVLRRHRVLVLGIALSAAALAFGLSITKEPVYDAAASLQFQDPNNQTSGVVGQPAADFFPAGEAAAGAQIVTRNDVLAAVSRRVGKSPSQLRSDVSATVDPQSNLVSVEVSADTAEGAARTANLLAREAQTVARNDARDFYENRARDLLKDPLQAAVAARLKTLAAVAEPVEIVRLAEEPDSPSSPKPLITTIAAAFLGLLIGIGAAFLRETLDRRVTDPHEVQKRLDVPLVGYVREDTLGMVGLASNGKVQASEDDLESFRILRTNVDFLGDGAGPGTVVVTSPLPEEGKSTVAAWYAYANALAGRQTALVECDFRRPVLARRLGFDPSPGLSDYLAGDAKPPQVLRSLPIEGNGGQPLPVIPAGTDAFHPTELLGSKRFQQFLEQVSKAYELVVLDCAPLLPVGDTLELIPHVDGVLLCVRLNRTTFDQAASAKQAMEHLPEKPIGLVVTGLRSGSDDDYYGYYTAYASSRASPTAS